jgi:hypothetical protein
MHISLASCLSIALLRVNAVDTGTSLTGWNTYSEVRRYHFAFDSVDAT